nr:Adenosine monophosphate-protein transferase SoFic [Chlamydiota bacterium]
MSRSGNLVKQPTGYRAFIPSSLPPIPAIQIEDGIQHILTDANIALGRLDMMGYLVPNLEHVIAMYVRKEALLSSQIEGTQASLEDVFDFENNIPIRNVEDVKDVVHYIKALNHGIERLETIPMSVRLIKEIHDILLTGTRGKEKKPGEFRKSQNWIGFAGSTLMTANFVPPPPNEAADAMSELEKYFHTHSDLPLLVNCALIHYQFETIHPFLDGNGRVGRLLITFFLRWKEALRFPLLYMSYYFKIHRQEYYDRLNLVRERGDFEQWVEFFLKGIVWTADSAMRTIKNIVELHEKNRKLVIEKKMPISAMALLDYLFEKPQVSVQTIAKYFKISSQGAAKLIKQFHQYEILKEITGRKRDKRNDYWEY